MSTDSRSGIPKVTNGARDTRASKVRPAKPALIRTRATEPAAPFAAVPDDQPDVPAWLELAKLPVPSEDRLREIFGLTRAEARLAQGLARGDALEDVAAELQIKRTTARTQLAAIFAKTRTRRQAGLVAILSRLAHLDEFGWT